MAAGVNQTEAIKTYMETHGSITALEALNEIGCFRLAARIKDLRDRGVAIDSEMVTLPNGKHIAKYTLVP